jgi:hypothetical protein
MTSGGDARAEFEFLLTRGGVPMRYNIGHG